MKNLRGLLRKRRSLVTPLALGVVLLLLIVMVGLLPSTVGRIDFRAYWSASYLLGHGQNAIDLASLRTIQDELTDIDGGPYMRTFNPPWVLVWLLPYTWVGFDLAAKMWLLTNIAALSFSIITSWKMLLPQEREGQALLWLPFLAAILFTATIISLRNGQANLIVLAGLVAFLHFYGRRQDAAAGLALALTTFKPHLIYLVLPILILHSWKQRRWKVSLTFAGLILISTLVALALRPNALMDYVQGTGADSWLIWGSSSFVTFLSVRTGWTWIRLVSVGLLPLTLLSWLIVGKKWELMKVAQIGVMASLITVPYVWNHDSVMLLLPLTQILVWLVTERLPRTEKLVLTLFLFFIYAAYFVQRIATSGVPAELDFYWVPLALAAIYGWINWRLVSAGTPTPA